MFHPAAICRGPIIDSVDLGLVEEFNTVSSFARKPVKITMTGPHLLAAVAYDEYYNDVKAMMADFGKLLHQNFKKLVAAGCKHIQIDEPYFTPSAEHEVATAVDVINLSIEGIPDDVHVSVHICQGNYAVGPDYDGQIGHRYFDTGRYKADLVCKIDCDCLPDRTRHDASLRRIAWQQAARRRRRRRAGAKRRDGRANRGSDQGPSWLTPEQTIITSSCGFNHLPRHVALGKMRAMTEAQASLRGR